MNLESMLIDISIVHSFYHFTMRCLGFVSTKYSRTLVYYFPSLRVLDLQAKKNPTENSVLP